MQRTCFSSLVPYAVFFSSFSFFFSQWPIESHLSFCSLPLKLWPVYRSLTSCSRSPSHLLLSRSVSQRTSGSSLYSCSGNELSGSGAGASVGG